MRKVVRLVTAVVLGTGLAGGMTGCVATRDYVDNKDNEYQKAMAGRIDELIRESKATRADLTALTGRVGTAETRITQAQAKADQAQAKADQAQAKADQVGGGLNAALASRFKRERVGEVGVLFALGQYTLSKAGQAVLDDVVATMAKSPTYTLDIVGFTDPTGSERTNVNLSWQREETVRRRLIEAGVDMNRVYFIGFGEDLAKGKTPTEMKQERHVAIRVFKPAD